MPKRRADIAELLTAALSKSEAALLEALLEAYRHRPLPALAELITLIGKRCAVEHPMTGSLNDQHATWQAVAAKRCPVDVEWLIANVITGRVEYSLERIAQLENWPIDPRMSTGLLALSGDKKMTTARTFWREVFSIVRRHEHPALAKLIAPMLELQPQTSFERSLLRHLQMLDVRIGKLVAASPSNFEREALAKLADRLQVTQHAAAAKTADDFLKEIWAAPGDDALREVFADWLQERGDPRGEFIALQLARRSAPRERALLKKHQAEWAAPFTAVLSMPNSTFERGFLHTATVHWRKLASLPALMTHPAWATVRRYKIDTEGEHACDAWIEHMISLGAKRD